VAGEYKLVINSDADVYAGSGRMGINAVASEEIAHHGRAQSASIDLPSLSVLWFESPSV
jgi:1,4-alpha-glucan branching enzyme